MSYPSPIAIDGPAAAGKGTLAKKLGKHLNFACLDTGALYRGVALLVLQVEEIIHSMKDLILVQGCRRRGCRGCHGPPIF